MADKGERKSYTHEYKLNAVKCFYDNDENVSRASTHFKVDRKRVREWVKSEETIQKQK